jgi:hypothetical protein
MPQFVPGLALSRAYYDGVVRPALGGIDHCAARLGSGSDVLGFDDERSTDHGWGPRVQVFVASESIWPVRERLLASVPETFLGWPTRYGWDDVEPQLWVEVHEISSWFEAYLGVDPVRMRPVDWLLSPWQLLAALSAGAVFHDPYGELALRRENLRWYPDDVWRYVLACQWLRIAQEEAFVGRAAEVDDELGSRMVAIRIGRELMRLAFLMERTWPPYEKWFGSAFDRLESAPTLGRIVNDVINAAGIARRQTALAAGYHHVATQFNALRLTDAIDPAPRYFYNRPYLVLRAERFAEACHDTITEPWLRRIPLVGSIDQFADSTDVLSYPDVARKLASIYS